MNAYVPPSSFDVRVRQQDAKGFRIWLPFFLLWPLLLVVLGFALVVALVVDLALACDRLPYHHFTLLLVHSLHLLAAVRGTRAHIDGDRTLVDVNIY